MRRMSALKLGRAAVLGGAAALALTVLASVGAAVSPSSSPAAASQYEKKEFICHRTGSKKNPYRTIRVSGRAVETHLRHGDGFGRCATAVFTVCHKAKNGKTRTLKVKGAKAHRKHLRHGDKIRACKGKGKGKDKGKERNKSKDKNKGKGKKKGGKP
jgi:hypothetical protein